MSLTADLLALALSLPGVRHDAHATARARATIDAIVLDSRTPAEARLALVWSYRESSWRTSVVGDDGRSLGLCQNSLAEIAAARSTPKLVLASRVEAARVCLHTIRLGRVRCGSLRAGLGYVATGRCAPRLAIVVDRCRDAGVTC